MRPSDRAASASTDEPCCGARRDEPREHLMPPADFCHTDHETRAMPANDVPSPFVDRTWGRPLRIAHDDWSSLALLHSTSAPRTHRLDRVCTSTVRYMRETTQLADKSPPRRVEEGTSPSLPDRRHPRRRGRSFVPRMAVAVHPLSHPLRRLSRLDVVRADRPAVPRLHVQLGLSRKKPGLAKSRGDFGFLEGRKPKLPAMTPRV